ncbi:acyl-CoA dehydrogenase family protein [Glutamicibacter uratoxydans]|uniref:acyl-CoA dehydrogenase family protein n=1 Tax=Glutamicibacter uratoxydans TaxID=43667 RepID=UPI003D700CE2
MQTTTSLSISDLAKYVAEHSLEADQAGQLPLEMANKIREAGVIKMLQPKDYGGAEVHPLEFFDAVMEIGAAYPSAGWVAGVVGVHSFEIAQVDLRVQEEIWGQDVDTWVASPYAPMGRATKVDGGYMFSGRWPFSSGTDNCEWVVIGGVIEPDSLAEGENPRRHFILKRDQYTIDQDSWNVIGLKGTGSKDLIVDNVFVPDYRVVNPLDLTSGAAAKAVNRDNALYRTNWYMMFSGAITAATLAMAEGSVNHFIEALGTSKRDATAKSLRDPHVVSALGKVTAELTRCRTQFRHDIAEMYAQAERGDRMSEDQRLLVRRNQVAISQQAVSSVEQLFLLGGGHTMREGTALQRYWRDIHSAANHSANFAQPVFTAYGSQTLHGFIPEGVRF